MPMLRVVIAVLWVAWAVVMVPRLWRSYWQGPWSKLFCIQQAWGGGVFFFVAIGGFVPRTGWPPFVILGLEFVCLTGLIATMWKMWPDIGGTGGYPARIPRASDGDDAAR